MNPFLTKAKKKAAQILEDKPALTKLVAKAERISKNLGTPDVKQKLNLSYRLLKAWMAREYKEVPWRSLITLTAAILYLVNPLDLVPDFIAGAGFVDDLAVIKLALSAINSDLERFSAWEQQNQNPPSETNRQEADL